MSDWLLAYANCTHMRVNYKLKHLYMGTNRRMESKYEPDTQSVPELSLFEIGVDFQLNNVAALEQWLSEQLSEVVSGP